MTQLKIEWTRINNDASGNPRYVCHFLALNTQEEKDSMLGDINRTDKLYAMAVKRANRLGGRKYNNKSYGGGIVFQSYNLRDTEMHIERVLKEEV